MVAVQSPLPPSHMPSVAASHTSHTSHASHTSTKSKKSSGHDRTRSKERSKTRHGIEKPVVKTTNLHHDISPKSSAPPRPEIPSETLTAMIGGPSRRSRCAHDFLLDVAKRTPLHILEEFGRKFKIVTGSEAVNFYKGFLGGKGTAEILAAKENSLASKDSLPQIVFAVTIIDAGRKLVDYYATWHAKMSRKDLSERKLKSIDSQFRKTARAIDHQFRRVIVYGGATSAAGSTKTSRSKIESAETHERNDMKQRPPAIQLPPPEMKVDAPTSPRSPLSATDSVMSLPFLNMIRGVPLGNRVPLTVTNPDRLSMVSSLDAVTQDLSGTKVSSPLPPIPEAVTNRVSTTQGLLTPDTARTRRHSLRSANSKDSNNSSAASTASTESRQSKHKEKEIQEFVIVLLDEKTSSTWHGLERQVSRSSTRTTPSRVSLWDGPLARGSGVRFYTSPRPPNELEESSSSEEDWDTPVIPPPDKPFFPPPLELLRLARATSDSSNSSKRRYPGASLPASMAQYTMSGSPASPQTMVPFADLSTYSQSPIPAPATYLPSPYMQAYASPYQSPIMAPGMHSSSRGRYEPKPFLP